MIRFTISRIFKENFYYCGIGRIARILRVGLGGRLPFEDSDFRVLLWFWT